mmetsp:Transcript_28821/g.73038  ORF Transcript_28821/g.73038 Transcript_28821/m.73038 type:complete len:246 (+) Transcript_28821:2933-3670(+)
MESGMTFDHWPMYQSRMCCGQWDDGLTVMQHFPFLASPWESHCGSIDISLPVILSRKVDTSAPHAGGSTALLMVTVCSQPAQNSTDSTSQPENLSWSSAFSDLATKRTLPRLCFPVDSNSTANASSSAVMIALLSFENLSTLSLKLNVKLRPSVANSREPSGRVTPVAAFLPKPWPNLGSILLTVLSPPCLKVTLWTNSRCTGSFSSSSPSPTLFMTSNLLVHRSVLFDPLRSTISPSALSASMV